MLDFGCSKLPPEASPAPSWERAPKGLIQQHTGQSEIPGRNWVDHAMGSCHLKEVCKHKGKSIGNTRKIHLFKQFKGKIWCDTEMYSLGKKSVCFQGLFPEVKTKWIKRSFLHKDKITKNILSEWCHSLLPQPHCSQNFIFSISWKKSRPRL